MRRIIVGFLLLIMFFAGSALASTWHVEKDGSGDFTVIQDAVDICASGDTIMVGPGWFEEYKSYPFSNGDYFVYVYKRFPDLTIIGAGCDETFIGSSKEGTWGNGDRCRGILVNPTCNAGDLIIENLTVAGVTKGIGLSQGSLEMSHCVLSDCYVGINSLYCPINVFDCEFVRIGDYGLISYDVPEKTIVADCRFVDGGRGFYFGSSLDVLVKNCEFIRCSSAGMFNFSSGRMYNCSVSDAIVGVSFYGPREFHFYDNEVSSSYKNLAIGMSADNFLCENSIFSGTSEKCISIYSSRPVFHNNDILKESGYSVFLDGFNHETEHVDMTGNYWGTDDPDSLAVWISDANDTYTHPMYGYVDYSPFSGESVPTEETTWDALKAMFR